MMDGLSLHYYTTDWGNKGPATNFGEDRYFDVLQRCLSIENAIDRHIAIMDRYDPEKDVALIFDEWGTWYDVEPGTNPGFLFQQNTIRDALVAGLTLNYLNEKCDRIMMANIAQTVNVLQALIFTEGEKMLLTPTYHIYDMYKVHHDATLLPVSFESPEYNYNGKALPAVSISCSRDDKGKIHISLVNIDPGQRHTLSLKLRGVEAGEVKGTLLTSDVMDGHNTFGNPERVSPVPFDGVKIRKSSIQVTLPSKSVVVLEIE